MEEWRISRNEVFKLIRAYRDFPCLWDYSSPQYKRNDLKKKCWMDLSTEFNKTVENIKKKIKCLRSAYVLEKKKVEDSKKSGASADSLHEPSLYYFQEFAFLDRVIVLRKTTSNIKLDDTLENAVEVTEFDVTTELNEENYTALPCTSNSNYSFRSTKAKNKSKMPTTKYDDALNAILNMTKPKSNADEQCVYLDFGRSVASQLKQLPPIEAAEAMAELQQNLTTRITMSLRSKSSLSQGYSSLYDTSSNDLLSEAMQYEDIVYVDED